MKKLILLLLFIPLVISCSKETVSYKLSVQINPPESGYVSPNGGIVPAGEQISLSATPADEYLFEKWSGSSSGTSPNVSVIMDADKSITANFVKKKYAVRILEYERGHIEVKTIKEGSINTDYSSGTILELKAVPKEAYVFECWLSDPNDIHLETSNPIQISVTKPIEIGASFLRKYHKVKTTIVGDGILGHIRNDNPNTSAYVEEYMYHGREYILTAQVRTNDQCTQFVGWTGDINSNENPTSIIITKPTEITGTFNSYPNKRTVGYDGEGEVKIEPLGNNNSNNYGCTGEITMTATAANGYIFKRWVAQYGINGDIWFESTQNPLKQNLYWQSHNNVHFKAVFEKN